MVLCTGVAFKMTLLCDLLILSCILAYNYAPCTGKQPSKLQAAALNPILASTGAAAASEGLSQPKQMIQYMLTDRQTYISP